MRNRGNVRALVKTGYGLRGYDLHPHLGRVSAPAAIIDVFSRKAVSWSFCENRTASLECKLIGRGVPGKVKTGTKLAIFTWIETLSVR